MNIDPGQRLGRKLRRPRVEAPIRWATVISVTQPSGTTPGSAVVRPSTASATDGSEDITARYLTPVPPAVNSVVRIDVFRGDVLILGTPGLDGYPGVPIAMAAGAGTMTITTGNTQIVGSPISFPTGRFQVAPRVTISHEGASLGSTVCMLRMSGAPSTSGFTPVANIGAAAGSNLTVAFSWIAVQMLTANGSG